MSERRSSWAAALVAVSVFAFPAEGHAERTWRLLGQAASPVMSDGARYAAFDTKRGTTRVYDDARHTRFDISRPAGYRLTAIGGGQLLWSTLALAPGGLELPLLFDLTAHASHEPVGFDAFPRSNPVYDEVGFDRVGRWGLSGRVIGYHFEYRVLYNWRTGAFAFAYQLPSPTPDVVEALDKPGLRQRMCSPLRQPSVQDGPDFELGPGAEEIGYRHPLGLVWGGPSGRRLELSRCGSRHRRVLSRACPNYMAPCRGSQLGGGLATWVEARTGGSGRVLAFEWRAVSYEIATGHEQRWPQVTSSTPARVVHTRRRLFASTLEPGGLEGTHLAPWTIRMSRLRGSH
jgi:hypothetical protein